MHGAETVACGLLRVPHAGGKCQGGSGEKDAGLHWLLPRSLKLTAVSYYAPCWLRFTMAACWTKHKTKPRAACVRVARAMTGQARWKRSWRNLAVSARNAEGLHCTRLLQFLARHGRNRRA